MCDMFIACHLSSDIIFCSCIIIMPKRLILAICHWHFGLLYISNMSSDRLQVARGKWQVTNAAQMKSLRLQLTNILHSTHNNLSYVTDTLTYSLLSLTVLISNDCCSHLSSFICPLQPVTWHIILSLTVKILKLLCVLCNMFVICHCHLDIFSIQYQTFNVCCVCHMSTSTSSHLTYYLLSLTLSNLKLLMCLSPVTDSFDCCDCHL